MTEAEYLATDSAGALLAHLKRVVRLPPAPKARKWRLTAVALARTITRVNRPEGFLATLAAVEAVADGRQRLADVPGTIVPAAAARDEWGHTIEVYGQGFDPILIDLDPYASAYFMAGQVDRAVGALVVREVFGDPFRPVAFDPGWRTPTVSAVAEPAYTDRAFDRLPVLADALEDAGCDAADLLAHLRSPGPHVRGCWALDLVLGKA